MRLIDLSQPVYDGSPNCPAHPPVRSEVIKDHPQTGWRVELLTIASHTGSHVDAPLHFMDGGAGVDELPLDVLIGPARLICFSDDVLAVGEAELRRHDLAGVTRLLIKTRNSAWLASGSGDFHPDFTHITPEGAEYLVSLGVRLVGVDYLSVEQFRSPHHRTHKTLLSNGVVIVEGLVLSDPPAGDYELICLPMLLAGLDGAPARAVLIS